MSRHISCGLLLAIIGCCQAEPQIISRSQTISVYVGQAVMMRCQIWDPMDSLVSWSSVTYNYKISMGSQLLIQDPGKYSVISVARSQMWNLQILYVDKYDQGFYKCAIEGTDQFIVTQLIVLDRPSMLLPAGSPRNLTECCSSEGITKPCLQVCYPSGVDLQIFNLTTHCASVENLSGISKCFTGGNNLDSCCLNNKVDSLCLDICHNTVPGNVTMEYFSRCYADNTIQAIFSCFETAFTSLPSQPTEVTGSASCEGSSEVIRLAWSRPRKNPHMVSGYKIMYTSAEKETYKTVLVKNSEASQYQVNSVDSYTLLPDTHYKLRVSALADGGSSPESDAVVVYVPKCPGVYDETVTRSALNSTTSENHQPFNQTTVSGNVTDLIENTYRHADSDEAMSLKMAIGFGITMAALVLTAVIVFLLCFFNRGTWIPSLKAFLASDRPGRSQGVKLCAVNKAECGKETIPKDQNVLDITSVGKPDSSLFILSTAN